MSAPSEGLGWLGRALVPRWPSGLLLRALLPRWPSGLLLRALLPRWPSGLLLRALLPRWPFRGCASSSAPYGASRGLTLGHRLISARGVRLDGLRRLARALLLIRSAHPVARAGPQRDRG